MVEKELHEEELADQKMADSVPKEPSSHKAELRVVVRGAG